MVCSAGLDGARGSTKAMETMHFTDVVLMLESSGIATKASLVDVCHISSSRSMSGVYFFIYKSFTHTHTQSVN